MWVFPGAQRDVSRDGGPSPSAPSTHTRTFLRRAAVERRPRTPSGNLNSIRPWQSAASCLGKACVCARPWVLAEGAARGGGGFVRRARRPRTPWHLGGLSEGLTQTPGARASDPGGPVALRLWLQTAMAEPAFEPERQSFLQNSSESLLDPKAFPMILPSEVNALKSLPSQPDGRAASWRPRPRAGLRRGLSPDRL